MQIRPETPADFDKVYLLIKTAFETAKVKDGDEQDFAVKLRNGGGYIPELALVAEEDNHLIGHIMFTKIHITQSDKKLEALLLSPLSVLLEHRNKGIGGMLINEGVKRARNSGYKYIFLVGDPAYYNRFGFTTIANYEVKQTLVPNEYALALELQPNALKGVKGSLEIH